MCVSGVVCHGKEMRFCSAATLILALVLGVESCGPGRGAGRRRPPKKLTPLVENQYFPDVDEKTLAASGPSEGAITREDTRFHKNLVVNYNRDIIFKDEEGTGADRVMTQRCQEKLNTLAISVMNQWPGVRLRVTEGWDEEQHHKQNSLHYEGRAVDITTSDRDAAKLGMLARLAKEAGFDWVFFESRSHIHCSVKSEPSHGKYGGCFSADSTVQTWTGEKRKLKDLRPGEHILTMDPETMKPVYSEVLLFLDYNPDEVREFVHLELKSGRTLTVTPSHLLMSVEKNESRTLYAALFEVGDVVLVSDSDRIIKDTVLRVTRSFKKGVYAPLTTTGTVIVDGVVASCYATIDSQEVAHWAFVPIRVMYNLKDGFSRMWRLIYKPVDSWSNSNQIVSKRPPSSGVYWYAEILYTIGDYLIPTRMYK